MRALSELIDEEDSAWPLVQQWIAEASVDVEILPLSDSKAGEEALLITQVTTRSPMGAIAFNSAGIFIDTPMREGLDLYLKLAAKHNLIPEFRSLTFV